MNKDVSREKIVALIPEISNLRDESQNVVPRSNYDPNKVIHVLEDITLHFSELLDDRLETSDAHNIYYGTNDEFNIFTQTETSSNLLTEKIDTSFSNNTYPSNVFNDIPSDNLISITDENLIIVPSQIDIESQTDTLTLSNLQCSDTHTIQTFDIISPEESIDLHQTVQPDHHAIIDIPMQTISVAPDPPISDDDRENKLVPYSDSDSDSFNNLNKCKKRKKRFEVDKKQWLSEKNKRKREEGKSFLGRERIEGGWNYNKPKEARSIKPRCSCKIGKYSTLKCETVDEEARKVIFNQFWSLSWGEKKTLINEWVTSTTIPTVRPRNRNTTDNTKRAKTFVYHLKVNEERVKVCRKMFLNTLNLGRWTVQHWKQNFLNRPAGALRCSTESTKSLSEPRESLIFFLDSLPVMESHYCRATSQKLYLLPEWNSKESLYHFYVNDWCKERNVKALSIALFSNLFESKNLALFKPKKDQCEKCACFKVKQVTEEDYTEHIKRKNEARDEKEADKVGESYVFTVDLQAVLMAPKSNVSTLYYKTKLQVHNLCFFNIKNKDGFCFIWNEVEGGLNAEEFASIWVDFLENNVIPDINNDVRDLRKKTIIIYSDGCTYQNRNCVLSNALINIVMKHENIVIEQKFLEVGHTQMEADAMHSTIERQLKNRVINVPAEYISIAKQARKCPAPYIVKYLDHTYFKKIDMIQFYKSIRPGRTKGDPKVTDIRALRYESNGSIFFFYKTRFKAEWQPLPQRRSLKCDPCEIHNLPRLHTSRRKITARKFEDLQQIKRTLPSNYHKYYDDLPHE